MSATMNFSGSSARTLLQGGFYIECAYTPSLSSIKTAISRKAVVAVMADHIVGDVFAKLLENLSADKGPRTNLRSYLYEMAYHLVVDAARLSYWSAPIEVADFIHQGASSNSISMENRVLFETVRRAIQNDLTDDQRHVVILRFLEGFSLKETAAILGLEVGHVKVLQLRAMGVLRKAMGFRVLEPSVVRGNYLSP